MSYKSKLFISNKYLYDQLVNDFICQLKKNKKHTSVGISGGSTFKTFYKFLIKKKIDLKNLNITLTDERCVPRKNFQSNTGNITRELIDKLASRPAINEIYNNNLSIKKNLSNLKDSKNKLFPFDILLLGMGDDGHIASIFSDINKIKLKKIMNPENKDISSYIKTKKSIVPRITLNISVLLNSTKIFLILPKKKKLEVFKRSLIEKDEFKYPIYSIFKYLNDKTKITIYSKK